MVGSDSLTISQTEEIQPFVVWRSYFAGASTEQELCLVNDDGSLASPPTFIEYDEISAYDELSCITDMALTKNHLVLEYKIGSDGMSAVPGVYRLVVLTTESCSGTNPTNPIFTLTGKWVFCPQTLFPFSLSLHYLCMYI